MTLLLLILGMFALLAMRVPVAHAMLLPCLLYVGFSPDITMGVALQRMVAGINSFPLLAVPLFITTGYLANAAGLSERIFQLLARLLWRLPGRLAYVNVGSSVVFSWMSGAAIADAAGLGAVLVPAMRKEGYNEGFSLGLTGASSMIGPIMPPSIPAIIYAVTAGVSIGGMFVAGVVPAVILALVLCVHVFLHVRRYPLPAETNSRSDAIPDDVFPGPAQTVLQAIPILFTPIIILGGILGGVFTPTEAATAAVTYMLVLGICYQSLSLRQLIQVLLQTSTTTGSILLIVASASLFGWIISREQGPQMVAESMIQLTDNPYLFLMFINLFLLLVGMLLEPTSALLICVPVFLPVAVEFGIDPLHLGIVMILNLVIGLITPPVGLVLYVLSSVTGASFPTIVRGIVPFLVPLMITLLIVTFVPSVSLWLPRWFGF